MLLARNLAALADAVAALPRPGLLPVTTIVVPSWALGHALRRQLIETGRGALLAGARFVPPLALATEILESAGVAFESGEDGLRPARLMALLRTDLPLRRFPLELLRNAPGWETAFARTIGDLEAAAVRPEELEQRASALAGDRAEQVKDVALIWRALDGDAGNSWTTARVLLQAASILAGRAAARDATLAIATGHETAAQGRFLAALPGARLALCSQQPASPHWLGRLETLFGAEARALASGGPVALQGLRELDLLRTGLFSDTATLAAADRPRSSRPDGSVSLEEHAGVDEEVQAAADWVGQQILAGVALADIAVLTPRRDPWVGLVAERLRRLPWPAGALPVLVPGGLSCLETAAGTRLLALVQALRAFLPIELLPRVLVALRATDGNGPLDHSEAIGLAGSLGVVGGNRVRATGARDWARRARERLKELLALLAREAAAEEPSLELHDLAAAEALAAQLASILPALNGLDGLAALVVAGAPLRELLPALSKFADQFLLQPGEGAPPARLLQAALEPLARDTACGLLVGEDALRLIEEALGHLRALSGRFGEPAVFVGTVREAAGLPFKAVRVIGLCEGALPAASREDPVLPEALRRELGFPALGTAQDRIVRQLHDLWRCIAEARDRVVLSVPRTDADGSQRQPSSVLLEALAALGRPSVASADLHALRRVAFRPARDEADKRLLARPISDSARLWRAARTGEIPASWHEAASLHLGRARKLTNEPHLDGLFDETFPLQILPGVTAERSISASSLNRLLSCPHLYLFNKVLHWGDPAALPGTGQVEPMPYGKLFHATAERFFKAHGKEFSARKRTLHHWKAEAAEIAVAAFQELCSEYPLAGAGVQAQQRDRLLREVSTFVEGEWAASSTFVHSELAFGSPEPVRLKLRSGALHVAGRIDLVDIEDGRTLVRDLKTGRSNTRSGDQADATIGIDLQLAVYGMVVKQLSTQLGVPHEVGVAYLYVDRAADRERAFRDDFDGLEKAARGWLDAGLQLLTARQFPRTPAPGDCRFCSFKPVCGDGAIAASLQHLAQADGALESFLATKVVAEDEAGS